MNTGCEVQLARAPIINENLCGLLIDFEELVKSQSYSVAVTFQNKSITYLDLNKQANQLARYLRNQGIKGEELIAIFMGNSLQMIITILGILKAGGAYVPIDIHFPEERIQYILKDTGVNVIITQDCFLSRFEKNAITAISLDRIWCKISQELTTDLDVTISPHALAYVIYTSGSTGKPKGVMIEHGSISDKLRCLKSIYAINASDVFLFYRSAAYDASIEEYLLPLISGAKIVVVDHESNQDLISLLVENISLYKITILGFLPSLLSYFLAYLEATKCINQCWNLTRITVGGEMFPVQLAHRLLSVLPLRIYNVYGPTENTIDATVYEFKYLKQTSRCVPIGLPLAGTATYVLNSFGRPVRPGKIGELYIGGSGLARGYLNQPELTAEKFIKNPFGSGRLYKTGDLVRQLPDGNLEFIGRVDNQIKIRGYRIELDEINYYVQQYTDVSQSIVMAFDSARNEKYIVAYIVLVKDCMAREDRLKLYLKNFFRII